MLWAEIVTTNPPLSTVPEVNQISLWNINSERSDIPPVSIVSTKQVVVAAASTSASVAILSIVAATAVVVVVVLMKAMMILQTMI